MEPDEPDQQIRFHINVECDDVKPNIARLEALARTVCKKFHAPRAVVDVAIVADDQFRCLNRRFRGSDSTSDCLSFDLSDQTEANVARIFQIVLNAQKAVREANRRGHTAESELALYLTHGLLHNLGFDDRTQSQANAMHRAEDEILQQLGYGLVYNRQPEENDFEDEED